MIDRVECKACDVKLPMTWCVQSRRMVHIRGLTTIACERVEAELREKKERLQREKKERLQRARDIANDRGIDDQKGR